METLKSILFILMLFALKFVMVLVITYLLLSEDGLFGVHFSIGLVGVIYIVDLIQEVVKSLQTSIY